MKRIALVLSLALAVAPTVASAQIGFGLSAGLAIPQSDLSTCCNSGYHVQGSVTISPPLMPVGFRIDGTYDNFAAKTTGNVTSGSAAFTGGSANVVYGLGGLLIGPYVLGGVGMYHSAFSFNNTSTTSNNPGFNVGAGMKFGIGDMGATVEARYFIINGSNGAVSDKFIPITFGVSF